jgi:hypothetical protein
MIIALACSCVDSLLINGRGQRHCPPVSFLESIAPPNLLPLSSKGCIFPNNSILLGPFPNLTSQFPDQVNPRTFFGCDNTSNVSDRLIGVLRCPDICIFQPLSVVEVNAQDGYASINVVHIGGLFEQKIAIDGHKFLVYATDGQYIQPQEVDILIVPVGARCKYRSIKSDATRLTQASSQSKLWSSLTTRVIGPFEPQSRCLSR